MILTLIQILFVLIALAMVVGTFFPDWNFSAPVVNARRLFSLLFGLVILALVYVVLVYLFTRFAV